MDYVWQYPEEVDENGRAIYGGIKVHLGVNVRNMKMDLNIYGTWRWVRQ